MATVILSDSQVKALMAAVGFPESEFNTGCGVTRAESGNNPDIDNAGTNSDGTTDFGLWQINKGAHGELFSTGDWRDPLTNTRWAKSIWDDAGGRWTPWSTFNNGSYLAGKAAAAGSAPGSLPDGAIGGGGSVDNGIGVTDALGMLTDPHTYLRAGYFIIGIVLLGIAVVVLSGQSSTVKGAVNSFAK